jgi:hypothetical protein
MLPHKLVQQLHVQDVQQQLQQVTRAVLERAAARSQARQEKRKRREYQQQKQLVVEALHKAMSQAAAAAAASDTMPQQDGNQVHQEKHQQVQQLQARVGTCAKEGEGTTHARVVVMRPLAVQSLSLQLTGLLRWAFLKAQVSAQEQNNEELQAYQMQGAHGWKVQQQKQQQGFEVLWMQGLQLPSGDYVAARRGAANDVIAGGGSEQGKVDAKGSEDLLVSGFSSPEQRTQLVQPLLSRALELRFTGLLRGLASRSHAAV